MWLLAGFEPFAPPLAKLGSMKLRLAPVAALLVIWVGCGGAFTTSDQGGSAGAGGGPGGPGGSQSSGESAGSTGTGMGTGGAGGDEGVGGSSAGSSGVGGNGGSRWQRRQRRIRGQGRWIGRCGSRLHRVRRTGQCVAVQASCCGVCGTPELASYVGLNTKQVQAYHQEKCPVPVPCPACLQGANPNIAARCDSGHCKVFDVRQVPEYSACTSHSDCHLRSGLGCCVCNGPDSAAWVSLNPIRRAGHIEDYVRTDDWLRCLRAGASGQLRRSLRCGRRLRDQALARAPTK